MPRAKTGIPYLTLLLRFNRSARPNGEVSPKRPNLPEFGGLMADQPDKKIL